MDPYIHPYGNRRVLHGTLLHSPASSAGLAIVGALHLLQLGSNRVEPNRALRSPMGTYASVLADGHLSLSPERTPIN